MTETEYSVQRLRALARRMPSRGQAPVSRLLVRLAQEAREYIVAALRRYRPADVLGEAADLAYYWARLPAALRVILRPLLSLLFSLLPQNAWLDRWELALAAAEVKYRLRARPGNPKRLDEEREALEWLLHPVIFSTGSSTTVLLLSGAADFILSRLGLVSPRVRPSVAASAALIATSYLREAGDPITVRLPQPYGTIAVGVAGLLTRFPGECAGEELSDRAFAVAAALAVGDAREGGQIPEGEVIAPLWAMVLDDAMSSLHRQKYKYSRF